MGRKGKRLKAEVSVRYHVDDVVTRTTVELHCDADGETVSNNSGTGVDDASRPPDDVVDDCSLYPPDEQMDSESEEERDTLHYQRLRRAEDAWSKVRDTALLTTLQSEGSLFGKRCFFCSSFACCRCLDCSPLMSFCESCAVDKHSACHIFHHVEILKNGIYLPLEIPRTLVWPHHQCSNGVHYRKVMIVNEKGVQNEVKVQFCACEADFLRLLRFNLWAATPSKPELAFSISLMKFLHALNLECQVAVKDFCVAVQGLADENIVFANQRKLYPVIIDSFEEYRIYKHKLRNLKFTIGHGNNDLDEGTICPACPKDQGSLIESMDALFIGRKKSAGKSIRSPLFGSILFGDEKTVEQFVEQYPSRSGRTEQEACGEFLAGSAIRSRSRYAALSETAIFGRACRHEFPKRFINMKHGERLAYPVWILNDLFDGVVDSSSLSVHMLYDVACLLESHLQVQGELRLLQNMKLAIPIFHSYGHKTQCQIRLSPRRVPGFGLTDGEVLEHLWSFLRRFGRMTKEMRPNHRVDVLTDALLFYARKRSASLGKLLCDRMKRANATLKEAGEELTKLLDSATVPIRRQDVAEWANRETELTSGLHAPVGPSSWKHNYIIYLKMFYDIRAKWEEASDPEKLQQLYRHMNKLEEMLRQVEQEHNIMRRWHPEDELFQLAREEVRGRQKRTCLHKVHTKVVERWFLLSLKAKYADGHALAKRLSKQITKATKALRASVEEYNKTESSTTCPLPHPLEFDSVKDPDSTVWIEAGDFRGSRNEIPMAVRRKAVDLYSLVDRGREESTLLQSEMSNTFEHFSNQHQLLKASLLDENPLENCSSESKGRDLFIRRKLFSIEGYLLQLKGLFDDHVEDLLFQGELPPARPQLENSCEGAGAADDGPCLLSLPESHLHFSESESDSENDDFEEDSDSAFFSYNQSRPEHDL